MAAITNAEFLTGLLKALYKVARRRTTQRYADDIISSSIESMKDDYEFFNGIQIHQYDAAEDEMDIEVEHVVNHISEYDLGKSISSLLRLLYTEMNEQVGLYFLTELLEYTDKPVTNKIRQLEIDLDQIQNEQHLLYIRREKQKQARAKKSGGKDEENLLGYTWGSVSSWKHEPGSPFCVLYDKNGKVLDRINLDRVIQHYVERLSGVTEKEYKSFAEYEQQVQILEKDYALLEMMQTRDMDADSAANQLRVTQEELNEMIRKLTRVEMIHFTSHDTVELTEKALEILTERSQKNAKEKKP
jgi:hypothetical protein